MKDNIDRRSVIKKIGVGAGAMLVPQLGNSQKRDEERNSKKV